MPIEIKVPALGEGIESGDVLEVFVKAGDTLNLNDNVVELETDKATVTIPATAAGKVTEVLVTVGGTVKVGQALVKVEGAQAGKPTESRPAPESSPTPSAAPAPPPSPATADPSAQTPAAERAAAATTQPAAVPQKPVAPVTPVTPIQPVTPLSPAPIQPVAMIQPAAQPGFPPATSASVSARAAGSAAIQVSEDQASIAAGPAIRRFAREVGVDLRHVRGSGPLGRILRDDILEVVRAGTHKTANGPAAAAGLSDNWGPIRLEKLSRIRATIAQKMHESWSTVPRVTNFDDADVTELEQIRQGNKKDYEAKGIKLTTMPFLIKAVAMSLKSHPVMNASIDLAANQVIYKDYINIGIAIDSDRGLVVPSLRGADKSGIPEIARALSEMAESVRTTKFTVEDLRGSSFTISNLGAIGGTYSTPIINVPETAILLVGRSRKLPVVIDDQVQVRLMMPLSLSYDHRLIDGAAAARFLNDVIGYLQSPSKLLLAL